MSRRMNGAVIGHRPLPDWAWVRRKHAYTCPVLLTLGMKWMRWRTGKDIRWSGYRDKREPIRIVEVIRHSPVEWHGVERTFPLPLWMIFAEFVVREIWGWFAAARRGQVTYRKAAVLSARSLTGHWRRRRNAWTWGDRTWWFRQ